MRVEKARTLGKEALKDKAAAFKVNSENFIDGQFVPAISRKTLDCVNPASGEVICVVSDSSDADVDAAVASARRAFKSGVWSRLDPRIRMEIIYRFVGLIEENALDLALCDVLNVGEPITDILSTDIPLTLLAFQFFAETVDKITGDTTSNAPADFHMVLREPLGVVGGIVPWNYPIVNAAWKVAPALAAGNTVVLKPAEESPLSANKLAELFIEAGGPPGVFNVVNGTGEVVGKSLALHMDVDKISFTGSTEVGKLMHIYSGQSNMKHVSTECGGKSPQVFMKDLSDMDEAVEQAIHGICVNTGQVCNAGSRLLIQHDIYDQFVDMFVEKSKNVYVLGDPLDPKTSMGPLVSKRQLKRVLEYIGIGKSEGANIAMGGAVPDGPDASCFIEPTLFTGVNNTMRIAQEEIFGPIATAIPFDDYAEAIRIANDISYGLAASIWTSDVNTSINAVRDFEAGVVWVNCFDRVDMSQPWGGWKQTGNGRDKSLETLRQYTQTKSVWYHVDKQSLSPQIWWHR